MSRRRKQRAAVSHSKRRRRSSTRKKTADSGRTVTAMLTQTGLWLLAAVIVLPLAYQWLLQHWYVPVTLVFIAIVVLLSLANQWLAVQEQRQERLRQLRYPISDIDVMTPITFELACRDLASRDGLTASHVGGANDKAADVIAHDCEGKIVVLQCKHTTTQRAVGVRVMYEVNGTAGPAHNANISVVVTNGTFTKNAREFAEEHGIHMIDRDQLTQWSAEGHHLYELLKIDTSCTGRAS